MRPSTFQFLGQQNQFEDGNLFPSIGGQILQFQAGATLNVGDVVQIAGTGIVNKATTNPARTMGVVVGGAAMLDGGIFESTGSIVSDEALISAGIVAANNGQVVYVLVQGVFYIVADAAIANASQIKASVTTAGRVAVATSALTIAAGATPVTSTAANGAIISGDGAAGFIIGTLIDAAAVNPGDVRLAFINV